MECLKCGHRSEASTVRCTACGTTFSRAAFDRLSRIRATLDEAAWWAHLGIISEGVLQAIRKRYQEEQRELEAQLVIPSAASPPAVQAATVSHEHVVPPPPAVSTRAAPVAGIPTLTRVLGDAFAAVRRQPAAERVAIPRGPTITWDRIWKSIFAEHALDLMLYLGALLFVSSAAALIVRYWTQFPPIVQILFSLMVTSIFYIGGWIARTRLRALRSGTVIIGIGALLVPLNAFTIIRVSGIPSAQWPFLWLTTSLVVLPLNLLTVQWLREEFFAYIALASAVSVIASASQTVGLAVPWWGGPIVLLGAGFLLLAPRLGARSTMLHRALNVGGGLLGLLPVPWALWTAWGIESYLNGHAPLFNGAPVAAAWWAGVALAGIFLSRTPTPGAAYAAVAMLGGAAAFTASAIAPVSWISLALVVLAPLLVVVGIRRAPAAGAAVATACHRGAWALAGVGGAWSIASLDTAIPVLGLDAAVSLWWARLYRTWWLSLLGFALVAASLTAAVLRAHALPAYLSLGWLGLAIVYLVGAALARQAAPTAAAMGLVAFGLIVAAQVPPVVWPSELLQVCALGVAVAVSVWSMRFGDRSAGLQLLLGRLKPSWNRTLFAWIAAILFPVWVLRLFAWIAGVTPAGGIVLCAVGLLYAAIGSRLSRSKSPLALPVLSLAYVLSAVGVLWPIALFDRAMVGLALFLDTVLFGGLAVTFGSRRLAGLSAAASVGAVLVAPSHMTTPMSQVLAPLLVAGLYTVVGLGLGRFRATAVLRASARWAGRALAAVAFVVASVHVIIGDPAAAAAGYSVLALLLLCWSLLDEEPWSAALGAVIATAGVTVAVEWGLLARLGVLAGDDGLAWAALAFGLGVVGVALGGWRRGSAGALPVAGTVLAALALLQAVGQPSSEWWTLLFTLGLFAVCAGALPRGRLPVVEVSLRRARSLWAGYVYLVACLLPFWGYLSLSRVPAFAVPRANLGAGLVFLAAAYLGLSRLSTAVGRGYDTPWIVTLPFLTAAGLLIAASDRMPFVIASGAAALLFAGVALVLGAPRWFYPAGLLAGPAWILGLAEVGLPTRLLGPSLLALAAGELGLAYWLGRRAGVGPDRIVGAAVPFWIVGFILIPPALLWASISGQSVALATLLAGAAMYLAAGFHFRDSLFSHPVTVLLGLAYVIAVSLLRDRLQFPPAQWSAWLLPGVAVSMIAAIPLSRSRPAHRLGEFLAWSPAAPPAVLASGGAVAIVVLAWSHPGLRVLIAASSAAVYALGLGVFRSRGWLYPVLLAWQIAYGFAVLDFGPGGGRPLAVWFMPMVFIMAVAGLLAAQGRERGEGRGLVDRLRSAGWGAPFFLYAAAGILVWTVLAAPRAGALLIALALGTVTIGTVAGRWRDALLSSLAAIFAVATVAAAFAWRRTPAPDADVGFAVIALAFGALWWAAAVGAKRKGWASGPARLWADPLRLGGILLSAFAIGGSAVGLVTGVLGSDRAFTISLALVGFFALGLAVLEGREGLSYMAVLMLGSAWGLWAYGGLGVRQVQVYAIPGALYLLWVGLMQHRRARSRLAAVIDIAGLVLLLGSSLLQSVTQALASASLIYGALVASEALGILWWGLIRRLRRFVIAGIGVFAIDLVAQVVQPLLSMSRWVLTALVGLVLVVGALVVERQRETIKRVSHEWRSRMEAWH